MRRSNMDQHTKILTFLCPDDPEEAGRRYLGLQKKLEGYFRTRGLADPTAAADETLDRADKMIAEGTEVSNVDNLCLGIARLIMTEDWPFNNRESSAFLQFLEQHSQATGDVDRFSLMRSCLDQLPQSSRNLLNSYCGAPTGPAGAKYRRELAEQLGLKVPELRVRVTRLRRDLDDCVKQLSQTDGKDLHVTNSDI